MAAHLADVSPCWYREPRKLRYITVHAKTKIKLPKQYNTKQYQRGTDIRNLKLKPRYLNFTTVLRARYKL